VPYSLLTYSYSQTHPNRRIAEFTEFNPLETGKKRCWLRLKKFVRVIPRWRAMAL